MTKKITPILVICAITGLTIFNIIKNDQFFYTPISSVLTLIISLVFAFYYVQKNTDKRKLKDIYYDLLIKLQLEVVIDNFKKEA